MATISVGLARDLAARHREQGLSYVAATVFGRPELAAAAKLTIVVAGDATAIARVQPLLDVIGQRTWPMGVEPERANVVKLAGNFMLGAAVEAMAEASAMASRHGIAPADLLDVLTNGVFTAPAYQLYGDAIAKQRYDPPGFRLDDCTTQRNLSEEGRAEARRVGARIARAKVPIARVYTSPWCRCRETAMLAFGKAEDWMPLASFFDFPDRDAEYTESVKKRIGAYSSRNMGGNIVMVTHNVNIAALTKLSVATGEIVVVRPDGCCGLRSVGRLEA